MYQFHKQFSWQPLWTGAGLTGSGTPTREIPDPEPFETYTHTRNCPTNGRRSLPPSD